MYLEWAPDDILSEDPMNVTDEKDTHIVGEHQTQRALLEQQLEGTEDADIDTERVEVTISTHLHMNYYLGLCFSNGLNELNKKWPRFIDFTKPPNPCYSNVCIIIRRVYFLNHLDIDYL